MNAAQRSTPTAPLSHQPSRQSAASSQVSQQPKGQLSYQPKRVSYSGARRAIAFESSVKLTINLLLAIVATTTIVKLVPYHESQQARLSTLEESVSIAERKNTELREEFDRNFDPAQTSQRMQEQSGLGYPNQKKVVWANPPVAELPEAKPLKTGSAK